MTEHTEAQDKFIERDAGDGTNRFDQQVHGIALISSLVSCCISLFLVGLDQTIIFTLLKEVGEKWNKYDEVGWIATGYMLTMSVFVQVWGKASIYFGRKPTILLSIVIFEIGSLVAAVAPSMEALIVGRVIAGIGGGGIQGLVFIICAEMVPINKRPFIYVILSLVFAVASIAGPLMGGAFTEKATWRWCFYINLPLGGVALAALCFFFNPPSPNLTWKEKLRRIDYIGALLMVSGIVLTLLAITLGGNEIKWRSAGIILMFILGGLLCIAFCVWNFKFSKEQIIPTYIVKATAVDAPALYLFFMFFAFIGYTIFTTTYYQVAQGYGSLKTGVHFLSMVVSIVISSTLTGMLIKKTRYTQPFALIGSLCGAVGYGITTLLGEHPSLGEQIGYMILPGFFFGMGLQSAMMSAQVNAPKEVGAVLMTTAFINFSRSMGGAFGSALGQVVYNSSLRDKLNQVYLANADAFSGITPGSLISIVNSPREIQRLDDTARTLVVKCVIESVHNVHYLCAAIASMAVVSCLFFSPKRVPKEIDVEQRDDQAPNDGEKVEDDQQSNDN